MYTLPLSIVRYRAAVRSVDLVVRGDTRVGYNIISGEERKDLVYPKPIPKPASLAKNHMSEGVDQRVMLQPYNF